MAVTKGASEIVELEGHIIDSLTLAKVLDLIVGAGADYTVVEVDIGKTTADPSRARLEVRAPDEACLRRLVDELHLHGANRLEWADARLEVVELNGVLPEDFYATTNLSAWVRVQGRWVEVENPEMDCGIVVDTKGPIPRARTVPMHAVASGDLVVVGNEGVRVSSPPRADQPWAFEFMTSEASSEKPKELLVAVVASDLRTAREAGKRILAVCGPAVIHTGAGPAVARLVEAGWINVLFAGNGFATHDIEASVAGTSLGVSLHEGVPTEGGHANHLRVINDVRRYGSISNAVTARYLQSGVMYQCVVRGVPFVLGGSVRDDGPLPDVYTDVVAAADAMRALIPGVSVALMLASTLHAIGTGNLLPAGVRTYCVDINQAVATKLSDRGTHQALGIVSDVGLFAFSLADKLCGPSSASTGRRG